MHHRQPHRLLLLLSVVLLAWCSCDAAALSLEARVRHGICALARAPTTASAPTWTYVRATPPASPVDEMLTGRYFLPLVPAAPEVRRAGSRARTVKRRGTRRSGTRRRKRGAAPKRSSQSPAYKAQVAHVEKELLTCLQRKVPRRARSPEASVAHCNTCVLAPHRTCPRRTRSSARACSPFAMKCCRQSQDW